ncbi:MAG: hypothetical protein M0P71_15455 [Melioribacteraceae bacterium]|nr:hypothetical protein [Melioribacteraceae bacterium]
MEREPEITNNFERRFPPRLFEEFKPLFSNLNPEFIGFPFNTDGLKLENFSLTEQNRINYISAMRYSLNPTRLFIIDTIPLRQAIHLAISLIKIMHPIEISPIQKFEVEKEILSRLKTNPENKFIQDYYKSRIWYFRKRKCLYINEETLKDIFIFDYLRKFDNFIVEFSECPQMKVLLRKQFFQNKNIILLKDNLEQETISFN